MQPSTAALKNRLRFAEQAQEPVDDAAEEMETEYQKLAKQEKSA